MLSTFEMELLATSRMFCCWWNPPLSLTFTLSLTLSLTLTLTLSFAANVESASSFCRVFVTDAVRVGRRRAKCGSGDKVAAEEEEEKEEVVLAVEEKVETSEAYKEEEVRAEAV